MKTFARPGKIICLIGVLLFSACATPPEPDFSSLRAGDSSDPAFHTAFLQRQGEAITGMPFAAGNDVELLRDGDATFPAMLASIKQARHSIYMESFTFDAKAGKKFAQALVARRKAGVLVNLIYDSFGSSDTPPGVFNYLRANGVKLVEYNPITVGEVVDGDADHRDHRKLLIVDGTTAFVGGVNISVVYLHKQKAKQLLGKDNDADHIPWRDTHIKIRGPVVRDFERIYRHTWVEQHGSPTAFKASPADGQLRGDLEVEALVGAPDNGRFDIYDSLLLAIALAQHSIRMETGYFAPTPGLLDALKAAAHRGVDVELLLPGTSDSDLALAAGHADYDDLLDAGIKIYELKGSVLHAKTAVIDGIWSTVGSSNLDWRSAVINNECNAVILGPAFGNQMETAFQNDLNESKQITPAAWADRPIGEVLDEYKANVIDYFL